MKEILKTVMKKIEALGYSERDNPRIVADAIGYEMRKKGFTVGSIVFLSNGKKLMINLGDKTQSEVDHETLLKELWE